MPAFLPYTQKVNGRYGAPMGRRSDHAQDFVGRVHLRRVPFVDGDYDPGGAYWGGGGGPLFCAWDDEGHVLYFRHDSRDAAKAELLGMNQSISFYR